jgi:hypothetical protein
MHVTSTLLALASLATLILGAVALGGGIYETLLIDRAWPNNPAMVQPTRGGISRGLFWAPVHALYELALIVTMWLAWSDSVVRWWIVAALIIHLAARTWSFAYFIPNALRFEKLGDLTEEQRRLAHRWTRLSRCRPVLQALSITGICVAISRFGHGSLFL